MSARRRVASKATKGLAGLAAAAFALLVACSDDLPSGPSPNPGAVASAITIEAGDGQNGKTLTPLGDPLQVRVIDESGDGVAGITVTFAVVEGGGTLSSTTATSNSQGVAAASLTLGSELGLHRVRASVAGLAGSPLTFTARATVLVIEMRNIAFVGPNGTDAVTVAVGDTIEWVNRDAAAHTVTASAAPSGLALFGSDVLNLGGTFRFVPQQAGLFEYLCEIHPAIMSGASITVE